MKKLLTTSLFSAILLLIIVNSSFGQIDDTWDVKHFVPNVSMDGICMLPDGQNGFAVGYKSSQSAMLSKIFKTTNGGLNWAPVTFAYETTNQLKDVYFVSTTTGWVVGNNGSIYKTIDGGANWNLQNSGNSGILQTVFFINANEGWIGGSNTVTNNPFILLHTTNGGTNWASQSPGQGYSINDIFFIDNQNGWFGGSDNSINCSVYRTTNGGTNWIRQTTSADAASGNVSSVKFADLNNGYITVSSIYVSPSGPVFKTTNGGTNWTLAYNTNAYYNVLDAKSSTGVAVVSYDLFGNTEKVCVSTNGGSNWSNSVPPIVSYTWGIKYFGNSILISALNSQIALSTNNGINWSLVYGSPAFTDIAWSNSTTGWAVAGYNGSNNFAYKTTDSGTNWALDMNSPGGYVVKFVDNNNGFMLWDGNNANIKRTTNGGNSWASYSIPSGGAWIGGICFPTANNGWAYGSTGKIVYTTNGGVNWTSQTSGTTYYVESIFFVNATEGWAGGGYGGGNAFILHTTNAGSNWTPQTPPSTSMIMDLYFINNQTGWSANTGGSIFKTTNGGTNWFTVGSVTSTYLDKVYFFNDLQGWTIGRMGGSDQRGWIYYTSDGGYNWTTEWSSTLPSNNIGDFAINGSNLWVAGNYASILMRSLPVSIDNEPFAKDQLLSAYPNPFTSEALIKVNTSTGGEILIEIFSIDGRKINIITEEYVPAGMVEFLWKGNDYQGNTVEKGTYIIRIKTQNTSMTIKAVKL